MTSSEHGISFVVPAYNEEEGIIQTLEMLGDTLKKSGVDYEIIVVNDGSIDRTCENAKNFQNVKVISHPINVGYGRSIKTGILNSKYKWIGITDGDGTYPMDMIPVLLQSMEQGFDMVIAARENLKTHDSILKSIFRKIYKLIIGIAFHAELKDPNSGFRIFSKKIALSYFPFLCDTYSFTTSLTILFYGAGAFIGHVPVEYKKRYGDSKVRHIKDSIRTMLLIVQGLTFYNPMKFFLFLLASIVFFVCIPAMTLAMFNMHTLSLYFLIFGFLVGILFAFGVLVDTVRISSLKDDYRK